MYNESVNNTKRKLKRKRQNTAIKIGTITKTICMLHRGQDLLTSFLKKKWGLDMTQERFRHIH